MDLIEFLRARLDEDERIAAIPSVTGLWHVDEDGCCVGSDAEGLLVETTCQGDSHYRTPTVEHIARHDPARVLREVEAKRAIIGMVVSFGEEYGDGYTEAVRDAARLLAVIYSDHPDYREDWA